MTPRAQIMSTGSAPRALGVVVACADTRCGELQDFILPTRSARSNAETLPVARQRATES